MTWKSVRKRTPSQKTRKKNVHQSDSLALILDRPSSRPILGRTDNLVCNDYYCIWINSYPGAVEHSKYSSLKRASLQQNQQAEGLVFHHEKHFRELCVQYYHVIIDALGEASTNTRTARHRGHHRTSRPSWTKFLYKNKCITRWHLRGRHPKRSIDACHDVHDYAQTRKKKEVQKSKELTTAVSLFITPATYTYT